MKNARGMTLIEVLAAVTILAIVLGGATMLVTSIYSGWNNSRQSYSDDSDISQVINRMTSALSDCKQVSMLTNELRCGHSDGSYTSFVYSAADHSLTQQSMNSSLAVTRSFVLTTIAAEAPAAVELSNNVVSSVHQVGKVFTNGQLVNIRLTFLPSRVTVSGSQAALPNDVRILRIKLLKDYQ